MPYCSVKWCGKCSSTSSMTKDGITFHRFPICHQIKLKWINATNRGEDWVPAKNNVICSRHFTEDCFQPMKGKRRFLFESAIPTQMLPRLESAKNDLEEPSTAKQTENVNQDIFTPVSEHVSVGSLLNIPSTDSTPRERRLYRAVIQLSEKNKKKNVALKRLRDRNRILRRKVSSLKHSLEDLEKKLDNGCNTYIFLHKDDQS